MNTLNNVPSQGTFGQSIAKINENFSLLQEAISELSAQESLDLGYFLTSSELQAAYPSPVVGMSATVGTQFEIYRCETEGVWSATGEKTRYTQQVVTSLPSSPDAHTIYVLQGTDSWTEQVYSNGAWVVLATHSGAVPEITVDEVPTEGSTNHVRSGGVYPIKEKTDMLSIIRILGDNILDPTKYINGVVVNPNGSESASANWSSTAYIPIESNTTYTFYGVTNSGQQSGIRYINWYNANKEVLRHDDGPTVKVFTSPSDAVYVRCSTYNALQDYSKLLLTGIFKGNNVPFSPYVEKQGLGYDCDFNYSEKPDSALITKSELEARLKSMPSHEDVNTIKRKTDLFTLVNRLSTNMINPTEYINNKYIDGGNESTAQNFSCTDFITVSPSTEYTFYGINQSGVQSVMRIISWYDETKTYIGKSESVNTVTSPSNAAYVRCSTYNATQNYSKLVLTGMFIGASVPFEEYYSQLGLDYETDIPLDKRSGKSLVMKSDLPYVPSKHLKVDLSDGVAEFTDENGYSYSMLIAGRNNKITNFNIMSIGGKSGYLDDDVAPTHTQNTTIGANHGIVAYKATINSHGLTNTDIGTSWTNGNGVKFYVMQIVDTNNVVFLSENGGTRTSPLRTVLGVGSLTKDGITLNVTSATSTQLYPSVKNVSHTLYCDGKIIEGDGTYYCKSFDIVEQYEIVSTDDVLNNIIARAGSSDEPEYIGDSMLQIKNIYQIQENLSCLIMSTVIALDDMAFNDLMFAQHARWAGDSADKYLIPNSLPLQGYDFRIPIHVEWSSSLPSFGFTSATWADQNNPVNRVIHINGGIGFAIGYVPSVGVGKSLANYTSRTFEIRNNTGKIYPNGVNSTIVGNIMQKGDCYCAAMYRALSLNPSEGRYTYYSYKYNGATYVYVDYSESMNDVVVVNDELNGCEVSVVESKNATLQSDIYNGGINVKSTYVSGDSCFIVLRIK